MKLSKAVKPISYLKAHAAELIRDAAHTGNAVVITQNGEATAVLQDLQSYEETQESLALLKILAQSRHSAESGSVTPVDEAFRRIRARARRE